MRRLLIRVFLEKNLDFQWEIFEKTDKVEIICSYMGVSIEKIRKGRTNELH